MVCAVDHHAAQAGLWMLRQGGNAVDAAVAAGAVLAVTTQQMGGMGGDLFALVQVPGASTPVGLNASGRSGSGADPDRLRTRGLMQMPMHGDISAVTVPGCVDGWMALHHRFGRLPMDQVLDPAVSYAQDGFPASHLLAAAAATVAGLPGASDYAAATHAGAVVRRPGVGRALEAIADGGRDGFYLGEFGQGLMRLGDGEYCHDDLAEPNAEWVEPIHLDAWGARLWTVPPNSQGYLILAGAWVASRLNLPDDPDDPLWAHLLIEAARQAAYDRPSALHEAADGQALIADDRLQPRLAAIDCDRAAHLGDSFRAGGTMYMCVVDAHGLGVSLIQSNAGGFGSYLIEPATGIFLHNRGIGFSLTPGHPAEYGPRKRPPHTLSPALVTDLHGRLRLLVGTMGGDTQPQILLQVLARILHNHQSVGDAIAAPRWTLESPSQPGPFHTWSSHGRVNVILEPGSPPLWLKGLSDRGHRASMPAAGPLTFGHAQAIMSHPHHLEGAADPRALAGEAAGY
jgi:gamma-glutamyltranspeptidase/glutathione hydrolase